MQSKPFNFKYNPYIAYNAIKKKTMKDINRIKVVLVEMTISKYL